MAATRRRGTALIAAAGLAACTGVTGADGVPARWVAPVGAACIAQAEAFASEVTGQRVSLGPAAFDRSSALVLERSVARDAQGRPLDGRQRPDAQEIFELRLTRDGACVMRHPATGRATVLAACRAEAATAP